MRKNQLGCPYLPSDEFGAFPELLSSSIRILRASLREPCEQARVLAAGASSLPGWASPTACRPAQALARPLPCAGNVERCSLFLCVGFLSLSPDNLPHFCGSWSCVWCLLWGQRSIRAGPVPSLAQQRWTSAWPGKKPLLRLALLYSVGVFSAVVAEEAPRCRNVSGTHKGSNPGGSEQENHWSEGSERHRRVSALTWTSLSTAITANSVLILAMLGQNPVPLETEFLLLKKNPNVTNLGAQISHLE